MPASPPLERTQSRRNPCSLPAKPPTLPPAQYPCSPPSKPRKTPSSQSNQKPSKKMSYSKPPNLWTNTENKFFFFFFKKSKLNLKRTTRFHLQVLYCILETKTKNKTKQRDGQVSTSSFNRGWLVSREEKLQPGDQNICFHNTPTSALLGSLGRLSAVRKLKEKMILSTQNANFSAWIFFSLPLLFSSLFFFT